MTAVLDISYLATYTSVPQESIESLQNDAQREAWTTFLSAVIAQAQDHDRLRADRLRLDVELENAVRGGEARERLWRSKEEQLQSELASVRQQLSQEVVQTLQEKVSRLERSNRETLALLDARNTAHDKLAEEVNAQHQKTVAVRRELSALQEKHQATESLLSSAAFRESSLQQEVELLKKMRTGTILSSRLKTAEQTKFRREKNAKVAELQRVCDEAVSNYEALQRTEVALKRRLQEATQKAEESLTRIATVEEEAVRKEEMSRQQSESLRRLIALHEECIASSKSRLDSLLQEYEESREDAAREISQTQSEVETERQAKEAAESRIEELQSQLEAAAIEQVPASPRTPRANGLDMFRSPGRSGLAGLFTPSLSKTKGGLSMTQMYSDNAALRADLEQEKRRSETYKSEIDSMIRDLEQKAPEMQEMALEQKRLKQDAAQMASLLDEFRAERDVAKKELGKAQGRISVLTGEANLLRQQLRDLSAQVKVLLVEVQIRTEGVVLTAAERIQLQEAAQVGSEAGSLDGMSDAGRFISQRLSTFKNIFEVQERNVELLRLTRKLGEQMEGEEARDRVQKEQEQQAEITDLRERHERLTDELKSLTTQTKSYIRERDMFRRMLAHRGQLPADGSDPTFGVSVSESQAPMTPRQGLAGEPPSTASRQAADYSKLLKDMQNQYDAYRHESSASMSTLKSQIDTLAKEKSGLLGDLARANGQVTLAQERRGHKPSRNRPLDKTFGRNKLPEELIDARSLAESMRNEIANLKAEKDLWKRIEERLTSDNQSLSEDRNRLNKLVATSQSAANQAEISATEERRKLQSQLQSLETELATTKQKLNEEVEDSKKAALRREYDQDQSRSRIDDLMKSWSNVKEELVAVRTVKDQLEMRVEELKIDLRNAEARAEALQPRPIPRVDNAAAALETSANSATREQELAVEVADLQRDLELARRELDHAQSQIDQYKAISQAAEEELQSLNDTNDQFRTEMDRITAEKDAKVAELQQRCDEISAEMSQTNEEISALRKSNEEINARIEHERSLHESALVEVKDEALRFEETANFYKEDLKAQADIAQTAQRSYEDELVKHAEAAKALQKVRSDYTAIKSEIAESKADAEAARVTLAQSEDSWNSRKEDYEREFVELRRRRDDMEAQNKILHQQLDSVSTQVTTFQQSRLASGEELETLSADSSIHNLQEVIRYLRREKEIVDVQYELAQQEGRRVKQQLDYANSQLDDARSRFEQERQRQKDSEASNISHSKLAETINELNVFRESSVTLRSEARQAQSSLAAKTKQTRANTILSKYDRIDPAELEALKEQIAQFEQQRTEWESDKQRLQEQVDKIPEELQKAKDETLAAQEGRRQALIDQFKSRSKDLSGKIRSVNEEKDKVTEQLAVLQAEVTALTIARDQATSRADAAESALQQTAL
ncbi:hypothetical protein MRB53_037317 [Persea americana]|nr:hypothetical protein MRB53_037317 [Persea americana]